MRRFLTLCGLLLLAVIGGFLFHVKYQVVELEGQLKKINEQTLHAQEAIHVLKAEWAYLNKPERLETLAKRYLDIRAPEIDQMASLFYASKERER